MKEYKMIKKITALIFSIYIANVNATAQQPDILVIDDTKYALYTNPLKTILLTREIKTKSDMVSTANWKGYTASWEIKDNNFLLNDVTVDKNSMFSKKFSVLNEIFPEKEKGFFSGSSNEDFIADWYSGVLIVPFGNLIDYQHMGYGSTYENYLILSIKKGIVFERFELNNEAFNKYKQEKFEIFKQSEMYKKEYNKIVNDGKLENKNIEIFLKSFYAEQYLSL
jgi:hypothetical protein